MNAVFISFLGLLAVGLSPNTYMDLMGELTGVNLLIERETVTPNEPATVTETVSFDIDILLNFDYQDGSYLIEETNIFSTYTELSVSYNDDAGPGPFIKQRRLVISCNNTSVQNGLLTAYYYASYQIFYTSLGIDDSVSIDKEVYIKYELPANITDNDIVYNASGFDISISPGDSEAYNEGYQAGLNDGYDNGYRDGYDDGETDGREIGFNEGQIDGYNRGYSDGLANTDVVDSAIALVKGVFSGIDTVLNIEIIPGLKLSIILLVPIVFGVVSFFLNLWR